MLVCVWKFEKTSREVIHVTSLSGHVSGVKAVDCDAVRAVTASRDRTLRLWSLENGDEVKVIRLAGKMNIWVLQMNFSAQQRGLRLPPPPPKKTNN